MSSSVSESEREIERNGSLGSRQFVHVISFSVEELEKKRLLLLLLMQQNDASLIKKEECSSAMKKPRTFTPTKLTKR